MRQGTASSTSLTSSLLTSRLVALAAAWAETLDYLQPTLTDGTGLEGLLRSVCYAVAGPGEVMSPWRVDLVGELDDLDRLMMMSS